MWSLTVPSPVEDEDELVDVEQLGPEVRQRRPTIDDMIERLAVEQAMRETGTGGRRRLVKGGA